MKKIFLVVVPLLISVNVYAADSLTDQINAVDEAQQESEEAQQRSEAAARAGQQAQARRMAEIRVQEVALKQQKEAAVLADKKRDQSYEDQLRALDVQEKALKVEAEKARVTRSNDYIDQELKEKAARTDVIKSEADVNRNLSEGDKALLEKTGDAEVKKSSGIFR